MLTIVIQQQMVRVKSNCFIFLVTLLCASVMVSLEYSEGSEEVFLSHLVDPVTGEIDEDMVELLWNNCKVDLIRLKETNKDLNFCFPEETSGCTNELNSNGWPLAKENIQKLIEVPHPHLKQTLLDCVRKNNLPFTVFGEDSSSNIWYTKYFDSFVPGRVILGRNLLQSIAMPPAPSPDLAHSPSPSPSPSLSPSPSPSPSPSRSRSPSPKDPFFPQLESPPPAKENSYAAPESDPYIEPDSGKNNHKSIVIAVVVTAAVTFVVAALFFFCCTKICRKGYRNGQNDERPLLSLSLSEYSAGSSHKAFGLGNPAKEEKLGHQTFNDKLSHNRKDSSLDVNFFVNSDTIHASQNETASLGAMGSAAKSSTESVDTSNKISVMVPPPPGRMSSIPSLKPPPGRADPLPPEPPASLRPPSRPGPPPPPPPPAPPAPLKASGSTGPCPPGPPAPQSVASGARIGPIPPAPPKGGFAPKPPPRMAIGSKVPRPPIGSKLQSNAASSEGASVGGDADATKTKLKPFFWDKVLANPDHSMVWHQIKSGSFQFNEEMIETLFGYTPGEKNRNDVKKESSQNPYPQYIQILDRKKAQNLAILLRALNVTIEEVCDALHEGNELPAELLQTLLKMAPTADEELKLRLFTGELSQLGPAERFLKALVDIPFAFKRLEALLFMCTLQEEVTATKESFETLEVACKALRNSRLFLKLLEAVLKTGNRMNVGTFRGGAQAFKLDTLLKLSDVKGTDGKTTLLHFVVQEIIRSEGVRAARAARESQSFSNISVKTDDLLEDISHDSEDHYRRLGLQVVSRLSSELENVKKASIIDADNLTGTVAKLGHSLLKTRDFLNKEMNSSEEENGFPETLKSFVQNAEVDVMWLLEQEKRIMALVKSTGDYFHGNAGKDEGLRLFVIVRDFLIILDKVCKEVGEAQKRSAKVPKKESSTASSTSNHRPQPSADLRQRLFPAIAERRMDNSSSSSDDET